MSHCGCEVALPVRVCTCDFHLGLWLSSQQDIPESVYLTQYQQLGGAALWPRVPIENKPDCAYAGPRNVNTRHIEPHIALSRVSPVPLKAFNSTFAPPTSKWQQPLEGTVGDVLVCGTESNAEEEVLLSHTPGLVELMQNDR